MKKILGTGLCLGLSLFMFGCSKTTTSNQNQTKTTSSQNQTKTTSNKSSTTKKGDFNYKLPEYKSNYSPIVSDKLPEIRITSSSGNNDFVDKPISSVVKEMEKGWGGNDYQSAPDPYYENCSITVKDESSNTTLDAVNGKVKVRGNWTTSYDKKPLRIKFEEKQKMLGLNDDCKAKNWVLIAGFKDWSLLRDSVGLYMSHLISRNYASDFRLVELYVNEKCYGVYLLTEQQEIKKDRIGINEAEDNYTGTDIGYLLEMDGYAKYEEEMQHFNMRYNISSLKDVNNNDIFANKLTTGYTIKSDVYSMEQNDFIRNYMNNLWTILYKAAYNNKYYKFNDTYTDIIESDASSALECIDNVIDVESLVDAYIIAELTCDPDLYFTSFYMDVDFSATGDKKLTFEAPWDFDSALGNKNFCADGQGIFAGAKQYEVNHNEDGYGNPWMLLFVNCDWFNSLVKEKWTSIYDQGHFDDVYSFIDSCSSKYTTSFANNYNVWKNIGDPSTAGNELCNAAANCKTEAEAASYLKSWLTKRVTYLNSIWHY